MKSKKNLALSLFLATISSIFFSFTPNWGGEGFEVYLNNKLVLQKFGPEMNTVQNLQLADATAEDQLIIKYHHCGRIGKNRVITIKDGQNKTLKEFRYNDSNKPVSAMSCSVKEIINLKKGNTTNLKLYYTSSELPAGRLLASISFGTTGNTMP